MPTNVGQYPYTLNNKVTDEKTKKVDFLSNFLRFKNKQIITIIAYVYVDKNLVGRLDLIAQRFYGSTNELDLLLKFNDIDDMFAVPVGTRILVPDKYALLTSCEWVDTETQYSLDKNNRDTWYNTTPSYATSEQSGTKETVAAGRSKLSSRTGYGYTEVNPGVLEF